MSVSTGNNFTLISGSFGPNYETILVDQVLGGVRNRVSDKIKRPNLVLPFSSSIFSNIPDNKVLSSQLQIQQNLQVSQSSTRDVNYAEVTLSPQNEINDDINATYGYFNIGNYIGDPRQITSSLKDYPDLVNLKNRYFNKYSKSYNYKDYIRLSKYYDNAVFQMIKDFSPVRTGLATGVTVKQHLLERNRVRPAQVSLTDETLSGSIKPQSRGYQPGTVEVFSGGPGGSVNSLTGTKFRERQRYFLNTTVDSLLYHLPLAGTRAGVGTYTEVALTGGSATGVEATVEITPYPSSSSGPRLTSITVTNPGSGYRAGDTLTIEEGALGTGQFIATYDMAKSASGPTDLGSVDGTFSVSQSYSTHAGSGAIFDITNVGGTRTAIFSTQVIGTGYVDGEVLTITQADLRTAGFTGALGDVTFNVSPFYIQDSDEENITLNANDLLYDPSVPPGPINDNQAWTASYSTPAGLVTQVESSQYEFYNGEYSGSTITAQISHSINPDPILNNVIDNRASTLYQDVDYSYNARTPVNLNLILSGSAFPAIVPDSNYTSLRSITPRYLGSKNSGEINYSQSFADNSIQEGYPADRLTPWFAHFNGIYNSSDLGLGIGGNLNVTQLINAETLDTITLTSENKNLDFMGQLFKQGDRPSIIPATTDIILEGGVELEAVGELYQTILLKSGSQGTGYQGTFYPNGAINYDYASSNPDTVGFYNGIAVTQSINNSFFPNQASWFGYAPTSITSSIKQFTTSPFFQNSIKTVTDTQNHPFYGLPEIYTTPGTAESRSLAAEEIKTVTLENVSLITYTSASFRRFEKWTITSGSSITEEDNNLTDLPNEWVEGISAGRIKLYFSASDAELATQTTANINYPRTADTVTNDNSVFEENWFDGINSNPINFPNNFPSAMQSFGNVYIYNKITNEYTQEVVNPAEETYFPIQRGDFIRVGTTASLDTYTRVGNEQISPLAAMRVISYTPNSQRPSTISTLEAANSPTNTFRKLSKPYTTSGGFIYTAGLLSPLPEVRGLTDPADYGNQNFRILRRIPTEFYILVKNKPGAYDGEGLLLPENFDPKYDAREAAIQVGAISRTN